MMNPTNAMTAAQTNTNQRPAQRMPLRQMNCDILENENAYNVFMDLPGFAKDEIQIHAEKDCLSVHAEHGQKENDGRVIRSERYTGAYERVFRMNDEIDKENISATYENGVLAIALPKIKKEDRQTRIAIQ